MNPFVLALCAGVLSLVIYQAHGKYPGKIESKFYLKSFCLIVSPGSSNDFGPAKQPNFIEHFFTSIAGIGPDVAIINMGTGFL